MDGTSDDGEIVLYMPKSMVIHVEQHEKIPEDHYRVKIIFTDKDNKEVVVNYTVPILRYWEYDEKRLVEEKLYPLLPLQVFMLRAELQKVARRKNPDGKREAIAKVKVIAERIVRLAHQLGDEGKINDEDLEKITTSIGELFKHLNDKYKVDTKLNEEVGEMIKTLYDERVFIKGIEKGMEKAEKKAYVDKIETAKTLIQENIPIEIISKSTKLTIEEVEILRNEM